MQIKTNNNFQKEVLKRAFDFTQRAALVHRTHLREEVPKETKSLMQSFKLQQPTKKGDRVVVEVTSNSDYHEFQDEKEVRHLSNYKEAQPNKKMAKVGRRNRKQKNRVYSNRHSALYSKGLRNAEEEGLLSKFATNYKQKALDRTLKVAKRLAAEIFKL